ncbi:MAG: hypothetical protein HYX60_06555, partial [Legionella longbeachae]|nr:hypothetical protein [Legionella longbeachae]
MSLWKKESNNQYKKMDSLITPSEDGSYTRIKQISHIPLTIQALLKEYIHGGIEKQVFEIEIQRLLLDIKSVLNDLDLLFGHDDCTTQRCILMDLIKLLPELLNAVSAQAAYKQYQIELHKLKPLLDKNIEAAA